MNDTEYKNIIQKLNDIQYRSAIRRLNDLSTDALPSMELDIAPSDLTELEKALVCIALYWFRENVTEEGGYCNNASKHKIVQTKSRGEYSYKGGPGVAGHGGEIGAFWWAQFPDRIFGVEPSSYNNDNYSRQQMSQNYGSYSKGSNAPCNNTGWASYCAAFVSFCYLEALATLNVDPFIKVLGGTSGFDKIIYESYGVVKNWWGTEYNIGSKGASVDKSLIGNFIRVLKDDVKASNYINTSPKVGNIFYHQRTGGGHCGIVVKVDDANKKYYTIEGNTKRHDGKEGVAAKVYDFDEMAISDDGKTKYPIYFLSIKELAKKIEEKFTKDYVSVSFVTRPMFTGYFDMTCWKAPEPTIPDIPEITEKNPEPEPLPSDEIPTEITCPEGMQMYGYSPVRENDARDSEEVSNLNIAKLEKEYWDKYQLNLKFKYDLENDIYYACGPKYVPPEPCPPGQVRDKDGKCRENDIPAKCCDISIKVPSNPMEMLPITALRKSNNDVMYKSPN